jgi:AraC-like DNA-binding protein
VLAPQSFRTEPLGAFRRFASNDLDAARAYIGRVFKPHALRAGRDHRAAHVTVNSRGGGLWSVVAFGYGGASVEVDPGALERFYLLQFALRGSSSMRYGATDVVLDATSAVCLSPQRAMRGSVHPGTHMLVVRLDRRAVEDRLCLEPGPTLPPLEFEPHIDLRRVPGQRLAHIVRRLLAEAEGNDLSEAGDIAELLIATLCSQQPNSWQNRERAASPSEAQRLVRRVDAFMRAHVADDLDVTRLAKAACTTPREVFAAFRINRKTSPMAHLRELRLERAHHELISADAASVTDVALRCGFPHLGRFAALYRARYGRLPSVALRSERIG